MVVCATEVAKSKPQGKDDTMHTPEGAGILEGNSKLQAREEMFLTGWGLLGWRLSGFK